jgi:HD-GYP domain-containing protein (c-di-GMP phosphodiesterase class II)
MSSHGHYCVPILSAGKVLGVINLYLRVGHQRDEKEEEVLRATADVIAGIIERKRAGTELEHTVEKLRNALGGTLRAMALTVEARDPYTAGHQRRVADLARAIADEMGLAEKQIDNIRMAGAIHDLGKISVPAEILSKPSRLNDIEFAFIKTHPQAGYDILKATFPGSIAQTVLQHHERLDGSGYPSGVSGESILLEARVLAVADVVEAMASHRPYRPSRGIENALAEITQNRGILYDPKVVDACLNLFREKGFQFKQA